MYQPLRPQGSAFRPKPLGLRRPTSRRITSLLNTEEVLNHGTQQQLLDDRTLQEYLSVLQVYDEA